MSGSCCSAGDPEAVRMTAIDTAALRQSLKAAADLEHIEVFARIDSTNTYLKDQPPPTPGRFRVAIADHQTAGRGRRDRSWISEPGKSLCLSLSYQFVETPPGLAALTLALGVGVASCLEGIGVQNIRLKWPNDLLVGRDKLGGILTESRVRSGQNTNVIIGLGLNLALPDAVATDMTSGWADTATDLQSVLATPPSRDELSGRVIDALFASCRQFEADGFSAFAATFEHFDALRDREVSVDENGNEVTGIARGVNDDGALLIETDAGVRTVIAGSVLRMGDAVRS